ncbi:hypothetical protein AHF37_03504 [Paragonimus kellicotti]|nr:hypothetical protein AHF37_03504 [Paragonimus kellicotti]
MCITISGVFQLICIIVAAATANSRGTVIAAAVIFALNFVIYGIDAFFLYALYKVHGGYLNNPAVAQQTDPNQTQLVELRNVRTQSFSTLPVDNSDLVGCLCIPSSRDQQ